MTPHIKEFEIVGHATTSYNEMAIHNGTMEITHHFVEVVY
jgi:hypothetical protein